MDEDNRDEGLAKKYVFRCDECGSPCTLAMWDSEVIYADIVDRCPIDRKSVV